MSVLQMCPIHTLILDTTYCNPQVSEYEYQDHLSSMGCAVNTDFSSLSWITLPVYEHATLPMHYRQSEASWCQNSVFLLPSANSFFTVC